MSFGKWRRERYRRGLEIGRDWETERIGDGKGLERGGSFGTKGGFKLGDDGRVGVKSPGGFF